MNYSTLPQPPESMGEAKVDAELTQKSLYEALQKVADKRRGPADAIR